MVSKHWLIASNDDELLVLINKQWDDAMRPGNLLTVVEEDVIVHGYRVNTWAGDNIRSVCIKVDTLLLVLDEDTLLSVHGTLDIQALKSYMISFHQAQTIGSTGGGREGGGREYLPWFIKLE